MFTTTSSDFPLPLLWVSCWSAQCYSMTWQIHEQKQHHWPNKQTLFQKTYCRKALSHYISEANLFLQKAFYFSMPPSSIDFHTEDEIWNYGSLVQTLWNDIPSRAIMQGCCKRGAEGGISPSPPPQVFDRKVNPISTRGGYIIPTQYYKPPRIFRPRDGPVV